MSTLFYAFTGTKVGDKHLYHFDNGHISTLRADLFANNLRPSKLLRQRSCRNLFAFVSETHAKEMILILPRAAAEKLGRGE
jgi:hypothetical protein